jgi:hypothetical protein
MYINNLLDDNSFNDVDHIVNKVNYIFIQAANISIKIKTNFNNKRNKSKRKARPKFFCLSYDCLLLRKEIRTLDNKLAKEPHDNALRLTFSNCRREYNRLKNKLKRDYFKIFLEQVNELNPKNTKEFWNSINN